MASYSGMMWTRGDSGKAGIGTTQSELPVDTQPEMTREHCTRADLTVIKIAEH